MITSIPRALIEIVFIISVSGVIGYLLGRSSRETHGEHDTVPAEPEKTEVLVGVDDLKLLHGIDASIEQVLLRGGITSYDSLSRTTPAKLKKILEAGGSQFFALDTTSWPHQAALANQDRWMDLKKYQAKLSKSRS